MIDRYMKRCSISLIIRKIQVETPTTYYFTPVRASIIKKRQLVARIQKSGNTCILIIQPLWKTVWEFHKKLKLKPLYDTVIPLLDIYPNKIQMGYWIGKCTLIFIAVLFTVIKIWKQLMGSPINKLIKKRYICI